MMRNRRMVVLPLLLALAVTGLGPAISGQVSAEEVGDAGTLATQESPSSGEIERWWGALGAVACGMEFRLVRVAPTIGMNPYVMAAGIGGCLIALLDLATT